MILPPPFLIMEGMTALDTMKGAFRSTSMTWRKSLADISSMGMRLMMPALLTRMSMTPTSASTLDTSSFTASSLVTSQT